jgi:hypothetical protein
MTREEAVLKVLQDNAPLWTPGYDLAHPAVGGSEGLKRLRDLKQKGYAYELRKMEGSSAYEYRLKPPVRVIKRR